MVENKNNCEWLLFISHFHWEASVVSSLLLLLVRCLSFNFDAQQLCVYPPMASSYSDNEMQINNTCNYKV